MNPVASLGSSQKRTKQGQETHQNILKAALHITSMEGLESLSIGRLATELGMSKSGLFAHFGSKEGLQLATLEAAREIIVKKVIQPAIQEPSGIPRLWNLCMRWVDYMESGVFKGGCIFAGASAEFDGRPGPVRDLVEKNMGDWLQSIAKLVNKAVEKKELNATVDAEQLAFEINSLFIGANWSLQLFKDKTACRKARRAIEKRLRDLAGENFPQIGMTP